MPLAGWWPPAVVWALSFALFTVQTRRRDAPRIKSWRAEAERAWAYEPFASEAEWAAHADLLEPFRLPPHDPWPRPRISVRAVREAVLPVFGEIVISCCQAATWPLSLVQMALLRGLGRDHGEAPGSGAGAP